MIHSDIFYGIVILDSAFKTHLEKLSVLQNKALRIVERDNWSDSPSQYYVKLNILKLVDLYKFEIAKLMHQLVNNKLPPQFSSLFYSYESATLANNELASMEHGLYILRFRTKRLPNSSKYHGVKIWNLAPENVQKLPFN